MTTVKQFLLDNEEKLNMYTGAIAKVHSRLHPEVHEVKALYDQILEALKQDETDALSPAFDRLRSVTDGFKIPSDTCQTFEAVYHDLEKADQLHRSEIVA